MLYVTTRDNKDAHTAHKTLVSSYADDGGLYMPFHLPGFSSTEIASMKDKSFGEAVAQIINCFYPAQLTGWDVDFFIGRTPIKIAAVNRKMIIAQAWHNPQSKYQYIERNLFDRIAQEGGVAPQPTDWVKIAIRIALLFGVYGEMLRSGALNENMQFDVAVATGDFSDPIAAWYASQMGLPIQKIICSCDKTPAVWDLIHRKVIATTSLSDGLRLGIERLICAAVSREEAAQRGVRSVQGRRASPCEYTPEQPPERDT